MNYEQQYRHWKEYLQWKRAEYKDKFDPSELYDRWIPAFSTGERVRVRFPDGTVRTGTVGVTTGWRPAFLLMANRRCRGSSTILDLNVVHTSDKVTRRKL